MQCGAPRKEIHTRSTSQQLIGDDFDRIEPVQGLRLGAVGDADAIIAFAEAPEADGVKVVQTERLRDGVDEARVRNADGDDVGEVEVDEVDFVEDLVLLRVANLHEDEEGDGDEQQEGGYQGPVPACASGAFDLSFGGLKVVVDVFPSGSSVASEHCECSVVIGRLISISGSAWNPDTLQEDPRRRR